MEGWGPIQHTSNCAGGLCDILGLYAGTEYIKLPWICSELMKHAFGGPHGAQPPEVIQMCSLMSDSDVLRRESSRGLELTRTKKQRHTQKHQNQLCREHIACAQHSSVCTCHLTHHTSTGTLPYVHTRHDAKAEYPADDPHLRMEMATHTIKDHNEVTITAQQLDCTRPCEHIKR